MTGVEELLPEADEPGLNCDLLLNSEDGQPEAEEGGGAGVQGAWDSGLSTLELGCAVSILVSQLSHWPSSAPLSHTHIRGMEDLRQWILCQLYSYSCGIVNSANCKLTVAATDFKYEFTQNQNLFTIA